MWWIIYLLWAVRLTTIFGMEDIDEAQLNVMLQEAALDVYRKHMDEMSQLPQPPKFEVQDNFMRSYLPGTGVGNREELLIKNIKEISVFNDDDFTLWSYKRFNNSDYVLAANKRNVILNIVELSKEDYLVFSKDDAVFSYVPDYSSTVSDVTLFTRFDKRSAVLFAAILTENSKNTRLNIYEIIGDTGAPASLIDLGINPSYSNFSAKKISFVQSQYGGSLVVLIESPDVAKLVYHTKGSSELNHYIEVYYPQAVDMATFTVHGHGYIAVANATSCSVFKLDEFAREDLLFDRLQIYSGDLVDLEYFRLGFHHYLAVSTKTALHLYVWKSGEFSLKQTINGYDINRVYSSNLPTCRDDVILFLVQDGAPELFVYSGKNEAFVKPDAEIPQNLRISGGSIISFTHKSRAVLLFMDPSNNLLAFVIETDLQPVPNPIIETALEVSKQMQVIQDMMKEQTKQLMDIRDVLNNAVRTNGDQIITAFQTFKEINSGRSTIIDEIKEPVFIEWEGSNLTLQEYKEGTQRLEKNIEEMEKMVEDLEKIIPDIVRVDEDAVITGTKRFTGHVSGTSISALSVNLQSVAGVDIPQLQKEIYRLDKPQKIEGTLTFEKPLTILGNLDIEETLNGIDISKDVMTTNTRQTSHATMTFSKGLTVKGDLHVTGKINDIKIKDEVVTLNGTYHITGKKNFLNGIVAENVETQLLNGRNLNEVYNSAFTKSTKQEAPGTKTFNSGLHSNNILLQGTLNGYNISELAENIVRIDRPAHVKGHKTFTSDVVVKDSLMVSGTTNGIRIPEDLFLTDVAQTVTGDKEFTGTVTADNVFVSGTVDNLNIPEDIVTLSRDEELSSTLYFTAGINVENDIIVEGLVDGVDISEVVQEAFKLNETSGFQDAVFVGDVVVTGDLIVGGKVNTVDLDQLVNDIIFKDEKNIVVESEKHFTKVVADSVNLKRMINGYNITKDFMRVHGHQIITGTKIFKKPVVFNSIEIGDGMIGGLNITKLYENRISLLIEDEEIERDFEFSDHVVVKGNLVVHGKVGGLQIPGDIVLKNSTEPIANKVFKNLVKVDNLIVDKDAHINGLFGGIDLKSFYENRVTLNTDQEMESDVWIANSTVENLELTGLVNDIDIVEFANNVMSKTKDQTVTGVKEFTGETVVYGPITTEHGVNGVDLAQLNERAFKLQGGNYVNAPIEFDEMTVNNITVGLINGVDLTRLAEDTLKTKGAQHVTGVTVFENGLHVEGNIIADTVNDMFIPRDVLLKNIPQTINGKFTLGGMEVSGDLEVSGLVNGLDLSEIAPKLVQVGQDIVIESNVTFLDHIHVMQDIEVTGLVNGIDPKQIPNNILLKNGDQEITGHKTIRGNVVINGNIDVDYVNGMHWASFLKDAVRIDRQEFIRSPRTFAMDVDADNVVAEQAQVGPINGRILRDFLNDVVYIDVPTTITGPKTFTRFVVIDKDLDAELINGLRLKTDIITLMCNDDGKDEVQVITGQKTFGSVTVYGDVTVNGKVNSYDLQDLYVDTLLTVGNQSVTGIKTFTEEVKFQRDVHPETVNGMVLKTDLVTLDTDQVIEGPLIFHDKVHVEKDIFVNGTVNGIDIVNLANSAVYLDKNQNITAEYHFQTAIVMNDLAVKETVNSMYLAEFERNVSMFWKDAHQYMDNVVTQSKENCELAKTLQEYLSKSYYVLDGFAFHQDFGYPASFIQTTPSPELTLVYYGTDREAMAVSVQWDPNSTSFFSNSEKLETKIKKIVHRKLGSTDIRLHIGINDGDSFVSINEDRLDKTGFQEADILVRGENEAIIALMLKARGVCETLRVTVDPSGNFKVDAYGEVVVGKDSASISIFEMKNHIFLAVSKFNNPGQGSCKIYQKNGDWQRFQNIPILSSTAVKHFFYHNFHYLVFTDVSPVYETQEPKSIQLYRYSNQQKQFFTLFQKMPFDDAKGLEIFKFGDLSEIYLTAWNETRIQVFRLEGESGLTVSYTIHGKCIKDVKTLSINDDIYLAVGQQNLENDKIFSVLYKGLTKGAKYTPRIFKTC